MRRAIYTPYLRLLSRSITHHSTMSVERPNRLQLPGYNLPLNHRPDSEERFQRILFPNALDYGDIEYGSVDHLNIFREILMMRVMNTITDKPEWDRKVFDDAITSKWRDEIAQSGQDVTPKMMDYILKELQWRAKDFQKTGLLSVYDTGVVKSDTAVPEDLKQALKDAVAPFERDPEQKDYHPGSDMKVVDLVHPSLFPVVYGRTRILSDKTIGLDDCLGSVGQGELLPVPPEGEAQIKGYGQHAYGWHRWEAEALRPFSRKFQWLPCDVKIASANGECRIDSYINNVHPSEHRDLYQAVERIITQTIPLWNRTLTSLQRRRHARIFYEGVEYQPTDIPQPRFDEYSDDDEFDQKFAEWQGSQKLVLPEPGEFMPPDVSSKIDLQEKFHESGLQVIVKLANIELTPGKPDYEGGTWHVEGQLNERICATAIYYYDSENITHSTLAFRQRAEKDELSEISYEQDRHEFLQEVYGFGPEVSSRDETQITQELGSVVCQEGRLLTFPNVLQHRVSPFSLKDRSKPGHRKILALFLVDPNMRIISSANIPPQQEDWGKEKRELVSGMLSQRLPVEIKTMVGEDILYPSMSLDEAKGYRRELMQERSARTSEQNQKFETGDFSLCEH